MPPPKSTTKTKSTNGEIASLLSAYSSLTLTDTGKVQCRLSGHEMPPKAEAIRAYIDGSAYRRAESRSRVDLESLLPYIIPSRTSSHKLYCKLTQREINFLADEVTAHMTGAKFLRLKAIADIEAKKEEEEKAKKAARKAAWEASQKEDGKGKGKLREKGMNDLEDDDPEAEFLAAMDAHVFRVKKDEIIDDMEEEEENMEEEEDDDDEKKEIKVSIISKQELKKKKRVEKTTKLKNVPTARIFLPSEIAAEDSETFIEASKVTKRGSVFVDGSKEKSEKSNKGVEIVKKEKLSKSISKSKEISKEELIYSGKRRERDVSNSAPQRKKKTVKRDDKE
jgi:hypothetical protein